jgi:hypothetical protein
VFRIAVIMDRDAQLGNSGCSFISSFHLSVSSRFFTYNESSDYITFLFPFFFFLYILVSILNIMLFTYTGVLLNIMLFTYTGVLLNIMLFTYTGVLLMSDACTFDRLCYVILLRTRFI